jgi:hypothetical protein
MTTRRIYIAGPMTGIPGFNYPAFHAMAARLRELGLHVENPAEGPHPEAGGWHLYMRAALAKMVTCDTVIFLKGWPASRGACLEHYLALTLQMKIIYPEQAVESGVLEASR